MNIRLPMIAAACAVLVTIASLVTAPIASADTISDVRTLRAQLERMKSDIQVMDARLRDIESRSDNTPAQSTSRDTPRAPAQSTPEPAIADTPTNSPPPITTPYGPALRQAVDPAPYVAAIDTRISMFRYAFHPYQWIPAGKRKLVLFNTYDQAYLLEFANDCPGLLSARRIEIQNFSTRVKAGEHAVIADGQHCLITTIHELNINKLPKALRP